MVLIVEDEAISRRALQQLLRLQGIETRAAGSGEEAMQIVSGGDEPHLVLVDINLPGMSGVEFVRRMRRVVPNVACVFMTANEEALGERLKGLNGDLTLRKPFDVPALLHVVRETPAVATNTVHS